MRKKTDRTIELADDNIFQSMVDRGLRGMLEAQSFVTGVLYVELDVLPNSPAPHLHQIDKKEYKEIPTVPTHFAAIVEKLSEVDVKKAMALTTSVLGKFEQRLDELNMADISEGLTDLLTILNQILRMPSLTNSLASLQQTAEEYRHLSETVRARVDPLADRADKTLVEAQSTMVELRQDLQTLRDVLAPQAPLQRDLSLALNELAEAARSVNGLADYLTRHPDSLLRGRSHEEPKP